MNFFDLFSSLEDSVPTGELAHNLFLPIPALFFEKLKILVLIEFLIVLALG